MQESASLTEPQTSCQELLIRAEWFRECARPSSLGISRTKYPDKGLEAKPACIAKSRGVWGGTRAEARVSLLPQDKTGSVGLLASSPKHPDMLE